MGKNIGKNISKSLSGTHSQKLLYRAKKTSSKRVIQKIAEATGDLNSNKIATKITKFSTNLQRNNPETVTNDNDKEIPKETPKGRYISLKKKKKYWWTKIDKII